MSRVGAGLARLIKDPVVCLIGDFDDQWKIIPAKAGGVLPLVAVFVETAERDIVPHSVFGRVFPDGGFNPPESHFVNRSFGGRTILF